jgi:hypothetical protein
VRRALRVLALVLVVGALIAATSVVAGPSFVMTP